MASSSVQWLVRCWVRWHWVYLHPMTSLYLGWIGLVVMETTGIHLWLDICMGCPSNLCLTWFVYINLNWCVFWTIEWIREYSQKSLIWIFTVWSSQNLWMGSTLLCIQMTLFQFSDIWTPFGPTTDPNVFRWVTSYRSCEVSTKHSSSSVL